MKTLQFVALDLETTGLDPKTDTIIEIAAIKFSLQYEENKIILTNADERSMLINPWIPLTEEVTLITHITEKMLIGKPKWEEIQEKVQNFISKNDIILGHNVFFDVEMLGSHGINLSQNPIIDTFELSEIFSQDASSLNLGFLADFYNISKKWAEHRALTDTWISVEIFIHFLKIAQNLSEIQKEIWHKIALLPHSPFYILKNFFIEISDFSHYENWKKNLETNEYKNLHFQKNQDENSENFEIFSIENTPKTETEYIKENFQKFKNLHIITLNKKIATSLQERLNKAEIPSFLAYEFYHFIYAEGIIIEAEKAQENRKFFIFLLKMMFWLANTKTGIVNELKYYGDEFEFLEKFRLTNEETNIFRENYEKKLSEHSIIIEAFHKNIEPKWKIIFRDIALMEGIIRHNMSQKISFEHLINHISEFQNPHSKPLIEAINIVESLYESIPSRPTGENPNPPWKYGETYFLTQNDIWGKWCKWLSIGTHKLIQNFLEWKKFCKNANTRNEKIVYKKICENIEMLIAFQTQEIYNFGVIIHIIDGKISCEFISQKLGKESEKFFKNAIGYGFHIDENIQKFLAQEIPNEKIIFWKNTTGDKITTFENEKNFWTQWKTLILTTSMKHIREIGGKFWNEKKIFMQWISGGKSKMKHYFLSEWEHILIGLLDSWRDENEILEKTDTLIIAKIPFDPPTDPYFLAKTIGMKNSFEIYSKPVVLSKLNTLIGNAKTANPHIKIICSDIRTETTEWGKFIKEHIF